MVCQTFLPKYDELPRTEDASLSFSETSPTESKSDDLSISSSRACTISQKFRRGVGQSFGRATARVSCWLNHLFELFSPVLPGCCSAQVSREALISESLASQPCLPHLITRITPLRSNLGILRISKV